MNVYFVRHGEPDFEPVNQAGYVGYGRDLSGLTAAGRKDAQKKAQDARLAKATLVLSSPYTRALETAHYFAEGRQLVVELGLHEWRPDKTGRQLTSGAEAVAAFEQYSLTPEQVPADFFMTYETRQEIVARVEDTLARYQQYEQVIVVTHGIVIRTMTGRKGPIEYCEIVEWHN
ncbi:phosphoglycerate mutase [Enterococcus canis]|uniref:Phosphoglycerate mutase n=1 Tax=Enterococcus canis TaxID=214095 RepID=A0A1L8RK79_9ENTE|nr:histidine phosphatase family protein [Enterococcus canis]OJG20166.1 phosphoglycerate mutase [Enterococcus canis]